MKITKRKRLDKRFKTTTVLKRWFNKYTLASAMWGFLIGSMLGMYFSLNSQISSPEALESTFVPQVVKIKAEESKDVKTPLKYIRIKGQELGFDDYTISKFIRVARCESGFNLDPNAKNPNSTATGVFQIIIGTWDGNRCTGERWDFKDNIDCAYKLLDRRGFQPWEASAHCWQ